MSKQEAKGSNRKRKRNLLKDEETEPPSLEIIVISAPLKGQNRYKRNGLAATFGSSPFEKAAPS
ncbi:MAG TPA: hypothetical protein VKY85_11930 [Candidatus Angelobacter sp.]|nr:hypothetical protein [Candidatus Angelobacter sp.]